MTAIECFTNITSEDTPRESYALSAAVGVDATIIFNAAKVNYTVTTDNCTTSATASLDTDFDNDLKDTLDFNEVLSAGTCNELLDFSGPTNTAGTGTVKFTMLAPKSKNLAWVVGDDKKTLSLQFFTGFTGSNSGAFCAENCTCYAKFEEI